uniref:Uncharacterized protein n=1 Tax=Anguilla anguilla TaxID=7936 RepID=A0A0E9W7T2_ANGAN
MWFTSNGIFVTAAASTLTNRYRNKAYIHPKKPPPPTSSHLSSPLETCDI